MFVIVKELENDAVKYFSMLAYNGTYMEDALAKACVFSSAAIASKQKDVLESLNPSETYVVKEVVLEDVQPEL